MSELGARLLSSRIKIRLCNKDTIMLQYDPCRNSTSWMQDKGFWQVLSVLTDQAPEDNEPHRFRPAEGMPNYP